MSAGPGRKDEDAAELVTSAGDRPKLTLLEAMRGLLPVAIPSAATLISDNMGQALTLVFMGQYLSYHEMGAANVSISVIFGMLIFPMIGITFALDTLASQIFGADPDSDELGVVLQRSWLVSVGLALPICLTFAAYADDFFLLFLSKRDAANASVYCEAAPLFVVAYTLARSTGKFFNNQELAWCPMSASLLGQISSVGLHMWLLPLHGLRGAAWAFALSYAVELTAGCVLIASVGDAKRRFGSLSLSRALEWEGVKEYLALGLPSAAFVAGEAAIFDLQNVMAGTLGADSAAAYGIFFSLSLISVSTAGGFSAAACAKAGAAIGDDVPEDGRQYCKAALLLSLASGVVSSTVVLVGHKVIFALYVDSDRVMQQMDSLLWLIPIFFCLDALQYTFQGIFSAMARNDTASVVLVGTLWGIGLPSMLFWKARLGIRGVMLGLMTGMLVEVPIMAYLIFCRFSWSSIVSMRQSPASSRTASVADLVSLVDEDPAVEGSEDACQVSTSLRRKHVTTLSAQIGRDASPVGQDSPSRRVTFDV